MFNNCAKRYTLATKLVTTAMVCLFFLNTVAWALPTVTNSTSTLQIWLRFNKNFNGICNIAASEFSGDVALTVIDESRKKQAQFELHEIMLMAIKGVPFQDMNAKLDDKYFGYEGQRKRIWAVKPVPDEESKDKEKKTTVIYLGFLRDSEDRPRYKVTFQGSDLEEILQSRDKFKIKKLRYDREEELRTYVDLIGKKNERDLGSIDEEQIEAIKSSFEVDKALIKHLKRVKDVKVVKHLSKPRQVAGSIEEKTIMMINGVVAAALSAVKYETEEYQPFLAALADSKAIETYVEILKKSKYSELFKLIIALAETPRDGVQSGINPNEVLGNVDAEEIDTYIDSLLNSGNISRKGPLATAFAAIQKGGLRRIPDELLMNSIIIREKGDYSYLDLDSAPDKKALEQLAQKLKKPVSELRIIIPFGQRHIASKHHKSEEEYLVNALIKAGITHETSDYDEIKRIVEENGIYENGNIIIVRSTFMAIFSLMDEKNPDRADAIMGAGIPLAMTQAAFIINAFDKAYLEVDVKPYQPHRNTERQDADPNIYGEEKITHIDRGIYRQSGITPGERFTQNDLVRSDNGAMIIAGIKECDLWAPGMRKVQFNADMTEVTVSVLWVGLSGDIKIFEITYETVVGDILSEIKKCKKKPEENRRLAELYYDLARTYVKFGNFEGAIKYCEEADEVSGRWRPYNAGGFTRNYNLYTVYGEYVKALLMLKKGGKNPVSKLYDAMFEMPTLNVTQNDAFIGDVIDSRPSVAELVRKLNQEIGDIAFKQGRREYRKAGEKASKKGASEKEETGLIANEKAIRKQFEQANLYYRTALRFFPPAGIRTKKEQLDYDLYTKLVEVSELFFDNKKTGVPSPAYFDDHGKKQWFIGRVYTLFIQIAKIYEENGNYKKAVEYYKITGHDLTGFKDSLWGTDGLFPVQIREKVPQQYEKAGMYERARKEYFSLIDQKYLTDIVIKGDSLEWSKRDNFDYVSEFIGYTFDPMVRSVSGYIVMDIFCNSKTDTARDKTNVHDMVIEMFKKSIENKLRKRYSGFLKHKKETIDKRSFVPGIYGIDKKSGLQELLWEIKEDGSLGLPLAWETSEFQKKIKRLIDIFEQVDIEYIKKEWDTLCEDIGVKGDAKKIQAGTNRIFEEIIAKYCGNGRYYHTLTHIEAMLRELDVIKDQKWFKELDVDLKAIKMAVIFHDFEYTFGSGGENEDKSAKAAEEICLRLRQGDKFSEKVKDLILTTKDYQAEQSDDNARILSDLDRAVWGSAQKITGFSMQEVKKRLFHKFEHNIRREHDKEYDDKNYVDERLDALEKFKAMDDIYELEYFREKYGKEARENIKNLIVALKTEKDVRAKLIKPEEEDRFTALEYMDRKTAIYPIYHNNFGDVELDVISKTEGVYDKVVILVVPRKPDENPEKIQKRIEKINEKIKDLPNVKVFGIFDEETMSLFIRTVGAKTYIRKARKIPPGVGKIIREKKVADENFKKYRIEPVFIVPSRHNLLPKDAEEIEPYIEELLKKLGKYDHIMEKVTNKKDYLYSQEAFSEIKKLQDNDARKHKVSRKVAFYAGSFDPVTNGHIEVIARASEMYEKVYVGVENYPGHQDKYRFKDVKLRMQMIKDVIEGFGIDNVEVVECSGLITDEAAKRGAGTLVRGAAGIDALHSELLRAWALLRLDKRMSIVLVTPRKYRKVSDQDVRDKIARGEDISELVPTTVFWEVMKKKVKELDLTIVGVFGGTGSGKTTALEVFKQNKDIFIIDFDKINRELQSQQSVIDEIVSALGEDILTKEGEIDRAKLRKKVFRDKNKMYLLMRIMYPLLCKRSYEIMKEASRRGYKAIVAEGVGIFKSKMNKVMDKSLLIDAPEDIRIKRELAAADREKSDLTEEDIRSTIKAQRGKINDARSKVDRVIDNSGEKKELIYNVGRFISEILPSHPTGDLPEEKEIKDHNDRALEVLREAQKHLMKVPEKIVNKKPIEFSMDLSLVPEKNFGNNIKTLARLILLYRNVENAHFVFKERPRLVEGQTLPDRLEEKFSKNGRMMGTVINRLREELREASGLCRDQPDIEKLIEDHIWIGSKPAKPGVFPVKIPIVSKDLLVWADDNGIELDENEYPVALEDFDTSEKDTALLRNFEAAFVSGFAKAVLVIAKHRKDKADEKHKKAAEKDFEDIKEILCVKLNGLYGLLREGVMITPTTLDYMIHEESVHRLRRAIELYLPSAYGLLEELSRVHENIQLYLSFA